MQRIQLKFKVSFLVNWLVYTIMAFIMSSFIHFILDFRDWCKDHYSKLVIHSQFKITLSPVMVQDFLSQSTFLLPNNSNCKFTFFFFLCLTYIFVQTYEKKHKLHHNNAFNTKSIHNTNFHKKIKVFHWNIIKVKLNYSIFFRTSILAIYKQKQ